MFFSINRRPESGSVKVADLPEFLTTEIDCTYYSIFNNLHAATMMHSRTFVTKS